MRDLVEKLERRCLFSVSFDPSTGLLGVLGTNALNDILLIQGGGTLVVSLNGRTSSYDSTLVKQISVQGLGRNDLIFLAPTVTAPATLIGGPGSDTIIAGGGPDSLVAGSGNDSLVAGSGNDTLLGGPGRDTLRGGGGTDIMFGRTGDSLLIGGSGPNNVLLGGSGNDTIYGGTGGGDFLDGASGNDLLIGGRGSETIIGGLGNDTLHGGAGNQTLIAEEGNDLIYGGQGNDSITCGIGNDTVYGGTGNDTIVGGDGNDYLAAGQGNDLITAGAGDSILIGGPGDETMRAGDGNDTLIAGSGNNQMFGGIGDCVFIDGPGNNLMIGGPGNDIFLNAGGTGRDTIDGGPGFNSAQPNSSDSIKNIEFFFGATPSKPLVPVGPPAKLLVPGESPGRMAAAVQAASAPAASPYVLAQQVPIGNVPGAFVMGGLLVVTGTPGSDTIALRQRAAQISVTVNGRSLGVFGAGTLPFGVFVNPGGGNDDVSLENPDGSGAVTTFAYLLAGTGNDVIRGGAGVNFFDMGAAPTGIKTIIGPGTDNAVNFSSRSAPLRVALDGSPSGQIGVEANRIFIPGNAVVYGGLSDNLLYGNAHGVCKLFGGAGHNTIYGGGGRMNLLAGGTGDSTIYGGPGIDTLYLRDGDADAESYSRGPNPHTIVVADPGDVDIDRHVGRRRGGG